MARSTPEIPNASMADIAFLLLTFFLVTAFLLLTFFLVTTTMPNNKGLSIALPPPPEAAPPDNVKIQEKNMFKIQINSSDALLIEGEPREDISTLKEEIKAILVL